MAHAVRALMRNPKVLHLVLGFMGIVILIYQCAELAADGAEIIQIDPTNSDSLKKAFKGAYGVFGVTTCAAENRMRIKGSLALPLDSKTKLHNDDWSSKTAIDKYLKQSASFYSENFAGTMLPWKRDNDSYEFPLPLITDTPFPVYTAAETGPLYTLFYPHSLPTVTLSGAYALAAFLHPQKWVNKDIRIASEFLSAKDIAKIFNEVSGKTVYVPEIDHKAFAASKDNGVPEELHVTMEALFENPPRDPTPSHMQTFREWAKDNVEKIFPK
ncbi:hypothetical protein K439DRAFT_1614609 [Ramaria rubella]|nr:hypothetical protein K439DRAFT_1614609 [Ramaria rubella]